MLPAMLPLLDRLGARGLVENHGFLVKHGATFHDQESRQEQRFYLMPWRTRVSLAALFTIARFNVWVRRWAGRPVGSRLEW